MSFIRYDKDGQRIRNKVVIDTSGDEIRVEQAHKDEVEINNIVKRHGVELINHVASLQNWTYDDVTGNDFQESMNALIKAKDTFSMIPSEIRKQFDNNPAKFMDFVHNPENSQALQDMGLANKPEVIQPVQVEVINASPDAAVSPIPDPAP